MYIYTDTRESYDLKSVNISIYFCQFSHESFSVDFEV
jgi:hypothetical protein